MILIRITEILRDGYDDADVVDTISLSRGDMQKIRLRRRTDGGADVGIDLPPGTVLHHGDKVGDTNGTIMTVQQLPEKVCSIRLVSGASISAMILAGHMLGNMHRPIYVRGDTIQFPLSDDSEIDTIQNMLAGIGPDYYTCMVETTIFVPHAAANVAGHR